MQISQNHGIYIKPELSYIYRISEHKKKFRDVAMFILILSTLIKTTSHWRYFSKNVVADITSLATMAETHLYMCKKDIFV